MDGKRGEKWNEQDILVFRKIVASQLQRPALKKWKQILLDIIFLETGCKKAILYDHTSASAEDLCDFLEKLKCNNFVSQFTMVVKLKEDSFIFKKDDFESHLEECLDTYFGSSSLFCFVDISPSETALSLVKNQSVIAQLKKYIERFRMTLLKSENFTEPISVGDNEDDICLTSVFGIFLGYPAVYWMEHDKGFGLGHQKVKCYQLVSRDESIFGIHIPDDYNVISFTIPSEVDMDCNECVNHWKQKLERHEVVKNDLFFREKVLIPQQLAI